jgi:acetyltransferase-like isoleucine patch superfamily enzyme
MKSFLITLVQLLFSFFMYAVGTVYFALALVPGIYCVLKVWSVIPSVSSVTGMFLIGCALAGGFFLFGFSLILLVGLTRLIFRLRLREGDYPLFSFGALNWAFCGAMQLLIGFTFIDFILLTPFANLLFRVLGAKLGRNVQINSKHIADASLLEIGDNTVIGGGATVIGHIVERGKLKLRKVRIGSSVTIGLNSVIMPGCEIGDHAMIGAGAVLLKNTRVEPRAVYFGVPAEPLKPHHHTEETNNAQSQS